MGEKLSNQLVKHRKPIIIFFLIAAIICFFASKMVAVNYNIADYLPEDAPSTQAINVLIDEYQQEIPNARVMVSNVTIPQALDYKSEIAQVDGVQSVLWLDDVANIYQPIEMIDEELLESYYKDGNALFTVTVDTNKQDTALSSIRSIIGDDGAISGSAMDNTYAEEESVKELGYIMMMVIPIVFIILLLTTRSWFEPVLFLITIGIAILLNEGTNAFLGEISFVTQAAESILQLAVSMDYAIVLLHRFSEFRESGMDVKEAMRHAVPKTFTTVLTSGLATMMGFAALMLMRFRIGSDMGVAMAKAIIMSLICVLVLLPALTVSCYKLIDKTQHRAFFPSFEKFGKAVSKVRVPVLLLFCILIIPSFMAQSQNQFYYGTSGMYSGQDIQITRDANKINETFGQENEMVLMVPKGDFAKETELSNELHQIPEVTSILSYVDTVGAEIPPEFLPDALVDQLISENYSRMVINVDCPAESEETFSIVEQIRALAQRYYPDSYYLAGDSVSTYDMRDIVSEDQLRVDIISIAAIGILVLLAFRSLSIPVILLAVIEPSIWINLSFSYFEGNTMSFISYLIIGAIQLGATVDYAILLASRYFERRTTQAARQSAIGAIKDATLPILTSASILTVCGFLLGLVSTNGVISELGFLIGRGAILSTIAILFVLPAFLAIFDKIIEKTTLKANFYHH